MVAAGAPGVKAPVSNGAHLTLRHHEDPIEAPTQRAHS